MYGLRCRMYHLTAKSWSFRDMVSKPAKCEKFVAAFTLNVGGMHGEAALTGSESEEN